MRKRLLAVAAALAAVTAVAASPAAAASVDCGKAGGVVTGTAKGNVRVRNGDTCIVAAAHVTGSISVQPGGALVLLGSQVDRNVQSTGAAWILLAGANTIGGSVQVVATAGLGDGLLANPICTTTIAGALMLSGNQAPFQVGCGEGQGNTIGSVLIASNPGGVVYQGNQVTRSAICAGNPPVTGGGNTAGRNLGCP